MQSSFFCSHGRRACNIGEIPKSFSLNSRKLPNFSAPELLSFPTTKTFPSSSFLRKVSERRKDDVTTLVHRRISSNGHSENGGRSLREWIEAIGQAISAAFPAWMVLGCLVGLVKPSSFKWVKPEWTVLGITLTMLGMGMTLTLDDLRGAFAMPKELLTGFVLHYSIMTPFLTAKLAGQYVAVDAVGLIVSTLQVVLLPIMAGAFLNHYFRGLFRFISPLIAPFAVGTVAILCGNAIAESSSSILNSGLQVVLAAFLLHASGFFFRYVLSRLLGVDEVNARTISIEVSMQNSELGVVLATQHFANPLTAVPCAVSSVCHAIFGSVLAGIWRWREQNDIQD